MNFFIQDCIVHHSGDHMVINALTIS